MSRQQFRIVTNDPPSESVAGFDGSLRFDVNWYMVSNWRDQVLHSTEVPQSLLCIRPFARTFSPPLFPAVFAAIVSGRH